MKTKLIAAIFAHVFPTVAPLQEFWASSPKSRLYSGGGNKHSRHTVAQDKRAALKARNKARSK